MSTQPEQQVAPETNQGDVFTVELPWGLPSDSPFVINELADRTSERAKNVIYYARLLDVEWSKAPALVEVCSQLQKYLPESDVKNISGVITRGRMLIPQTNKKIAEINERYGTEFPMIDRCRTQQLSNPDAGKANNKKKRKKRK